MVAEPTEFAIGKLLILGVGGLILLGGVFALVYWLVGRGRDEGGSS